MLDRYRWSGGKRLRCGITTGTCAALAAKAAAERIFMDGTPTLVSLVVPGGVEVQAEPAHVHLIPGGATAAVRKDAGDDVDVTDGLFIHADVVLSDTPDIVVDGGEGVGRVTLPGLDQPVGSAAINRVPRAMISDAVREVLDMHGVPGAVVTIRVPGGAEVARKTFNPKLGIVGGISILGTSGIVEPMSLDALRESVELEVGQAVALDPHLLVITPGGYGEAFASERLGLSGTPVVTCSNFIGVALDAAVRAGVGGVLLVGHLGKLVKVAAGVMDTHSKVADARMETLCAHAALAGASAEDVREIMLAPTTDATLDVLEAACLDVAVYTSLARALEERLRYRVGRVATEAGRDEPAVAAVVFTNTRGELCRTSQADALLARVKECRHG